MNVEGSSAKSLKRSRDESVITEPTTDEIIVDENRPQSASSSTINVPTASQFIAPSSEYTNLPPELRDVDFTKRISWRKFQPYNTSNTEALPLPLKPINTPPAFKASSPALDFHVHATSKRARATTLHLPNNRQVPTPIFMPVGTKGTIKSLTTEEITKDENNALNCPIILGNTYHLALQPGTELVRDMGGLHKFMNWNGGILTDSGGFQMVSLLKLAEITEEGVTFENPFDQLDDTGKEQGKFQKHEQEEGNNDGPKPTKSERMLLRPEDSITHQNNIGSDIMMALDDVVSSVADDDERFTIATYRTLRWLDRCFAAHTKPKTQNLFAIVQGGLDVSLGGLREKCLAGFMKRDEQIPGYAIGGLAGGESKEEFWKVVDQCCKALPDDKPRYLMGVGYPLDLVVCSALGVDMYDCVYPTRTARFGVALVPGSTGTMRLKSNEFYNDHRPIMEGCKCQACAGGFTRARLHTLLKRGNPLAATLMTNHNIAYMMHLVRGMREAIFEDRYDEYVINFINDHFIGSENGGEDVPQWVYDALCAAGINIDEKVTKKQ
jgi:tRNA-guanine transglycosylase